MLTTTTATLPRTTPSTNNYMKILCVRLGPVYVGRLSCVVVLNPTSVTRNSRATLPAVKEHALEYDLPRLSGDSFLSAMSGQSSERSGW
ncbi:hypothetical protein BAUCODRAFT_332608 [Baudoinia panamericana UAMH 10762]|uniref:Uncharacterized protein n=1 Tax=Baudoinia panamericana (strain UAMH 10762) TaxID=717646 RepID=M2MXJ7_BAUPA|nr:uncharacterized protein BAUCODRAFT_332608 [Baudoinia panamericana UAMH 10762]EMC90975.1 hypothetical protein BAUCODRAFT_332608 [Baudoinia panamericana UAMH 10762]